MKYAFMVGSITFAAFVAIGSGEVAEAFPTLAYWHLPASGPAGQNRAGAEGIYGTGGPRDYGIQCAHCHIGAEGLIDLDFQVSPPFSQNGNQTYYQPGTVYDIVVTLTGEHLSNPMGKSLNGMAVSFEDPGGNTFGVLHDDNGHSSSSCPPAAPTTKPVGTTYVEGDCHGILFVDHENNATWQFQWVAPAAGSGQVTMWYGAVDGNQVAESSLEDDVVQGSLVLQEGT
jgi:hypothetical protein